MKNQSGSAHVILIVLLILGLIGSLGFIFWQNFINNDSSEDVSSSKNESISEKNQSIKTIKYCAKYEKICFDYPSNWKLDDKNVTKPTVVGADNIKLSSPDGIVIIRFASGIGPNDGMGIGPMADGSIEVISATRLPNFREFTSTEYNTESAYVSEAIESVVESEFTDPTDPSTVFGKELGFIPSILLSNRIDLSKIHTYKSRLGLIELGAVMQGKNAVWGTGVSSDVGSFLFGTVMPYDKLPKMYPTKKEAKDMLEKESYKQAKTILLSARYEQ